MQKYGKDIHKLWLENGKLFTEKTSLTIAIKVVSLLYSVTSNLVQ